MHGALWCEPPVALPCVLWLKCPPLFSGELFMQVPALIPLHNLSDLHRKMSPLTHWRPQSSCISLLTRYYHNSLHNFTSPDRLWALRGLWQGSVLQVGAYCIHSCLPSTMPSTQWTLEYIWIDHSLAVCMKENRRTFKNETPQTGWL